ncbi:Outward rectifying potassium channel protein [Rhynchospora pubera]|uniref:Outward rectifying potassium channel protein n=1 Tax=Rhynchospora pubera TaxID=906938 RepID=A0AAV8ARY3_9POAL|nr:Outward rectifying potassium channel protein [Rhynchospora pubera]KAJ4749109.1 Outward rectifying potassium channel protein [Rhynchospora pubera]
MASGAREREPLLSSSPRAISIAINNSTNSSSSCSSTPFFSPLTPLPEDSELPPSPFAYPSSPSLKSLLIFGPSPSPSPSLPPSPSPCDDGDSALPPLDQVPHSPSLFSPGSADDNPFSSTSKPKFLTNLHRCRTAPSMSPLDNSSLPQPHPNTHHADVAPQGPAVVRSAFIFLACYLFFGVIVYSIAPNNFSSSTDSTHPVVDALYFCIVTMCTIGYGDITPATPLAKLFSILFVIIGFGFVDILLSGMVSFVLDLQESLLLTAVTKPNHPHRHDIARRYIVDVKKGRMRIRLKVALALGVVVLCVGIGAIVLCFIENLNGLDALYLSVMSVTTVGYGDQAFKTMSGRLFASIWLLVSTLAVARAFLYLAEMRIEKRHRKIAKWVLSRDMTVSEFLEADIDHNGFVTKSEFVVYKLKEMGKISEKDVMLICEQFERLDPGKSGKITLSALIDSHHLDTSRKFFA